MGSNPLHVVSTPSPAGFREISPEAVSRHAGETRIIDVREPSEWNDALGHIAAAENIPLATVTQAAGGWDRETSVIMVCRSGGRSARAAMALKAMGFEDVYNMTGGMMGWNASGLPVQRS